MVWLRVCTQKTFLDHPNTSAPPPLHPPPPIPMLIVHDDGYNDEVLSGSNKFLVFMCNIGIDVMC